MISHILFTVIIYPIRIIIECIFTVLYVSIFKNNALVSLAGLSIFINIFCLPLYAKAEKLQNIEREKQKKMSSKVSKIRKNFKGDEAHMILAMYYRENNYHPMMALRSSLSLIIQIPFFIAAYDFLSHLSLLNEKSLFFIRNLSDPDRLINIGVLSVNILPICMTLINLAASFVYTRGYSAKEKIQLYLTSIIFLILLYNSPSALVLYWTFNNIFSLIKNILFKIKNPLKIVYFLGIAFLFVFMIYVVFIRHNELRRAFRNKMFSIIILILFSLSPLYVMLIKRLKKTKLKRVFNNLEEKNSLFIFSIINLFLFIGCYIPVNMVSSDPLIFASINNIKSPFTLLSYPILQSFGLFIFWPFYLYLLFSKKIRMLFSFASIFLVFSVFINFFIFHGSYGVLSETLNFPLPSNMFLASSIQIQLINIMALLVTLVLLCVLIYYKPNWILTPLIVLFLCTTFLCINKAVVIQKTIVKHNFEQKSKPTEKIFKDSTEIEPIFELSKNGKNVFIIMLDKAIGSYFPLFLEERPEFVGKFDGFVYYPNTLSFFRNTIFGIPPILGSYEYSTYRMNIRNTVPMKDKHNESLLLLPILFKENFFETMVTDMPYVNYEDDSSDNIFDVRGIKSDKLLTRYGDVFLKEKLAIDEYIEINRLDDLLKRNILFYAFLETSMYTLRDIVYQNGTYWSSEDYSLNSSIPKKTINNFALLHYLPNLSKINENGNNFSIMINNLTHDAAYLEYPDYTIENIVVANKGKNIFENSISQKYYHKNAATYILLSKWFDYLKENNVWDNTRIIIVSDHGSTGISNPHFNNFQNNHVLPYNSILLVKDFNYNSALETDDSFMTTADVPFFATKDIIDNPINPFTNKPLAAEKADGIYIYADGYTNPHYYTGNTFLNDFSNFYYVHSNIYEQENWKEMYYKDFKNNFK